VLRNDREGFPSEFFACYVENKVDEQEVGIYEQDDLEGQQRVEACTFFKISFFFLLDS